MTLFRPLHLSILGAIAVLATAPTWLCRANILPAKPMRWGLGLALASNEPVWWAYRYSKEGVHMGNLPLQLCDAAVWLSVAACLTVMPIVVEFAYFAGLAGAAMALLTPNLISPWLLWLPVRLNDSLPLPRGHGSENALIRTEP